MPVKNRRLLLLALCVVILGIFVAAYLRFRAARLAIQPVSAAVIGRIIRLDGDSLALRELGPDGVALSADDVVEPFFLSSNLAITVQDTSGSGSFAAGTKDSLVVDAWIAVQSVQTTSRGKEIQSLSVLPSSIAGAQP